MKITAALAAAVIADLFIAAAIFAHFEHLGYWDAVYFSEVTALTVGYGDIVPRGMASHLTASFLMWTTIPAIAVIFSRITAAHTTRLWHRKHAQTAARTAANTAAIRQIAADLYKHHTGEDHPMSPSS